jgi:hypothetical protein
MRTVLTATLTLLILSATTFAGEIREFDINTIERLGNELTEVSQTRDKGATTPERKRAVQTAKAALRGKLFKIRYDYVVLGDPDGSGFLVYALGNTGKSAQFVLAAHKRVTVSKDGAKAEQIDHLSQSLDIADPKHEFVAPKGYHLVAINFNQIVSNKPVETLIYSSNLIRQPIFVATPDRKMWQIVNGRMFVDRTKPGTHSAAAISRKGFNENNGW